LLAILPTRAARISAEPRRLIRLVSVSPQGVSGGAGAKLFDGAGSSGAAGPSGEADLSGAAASALRPPSFSTPQAQIKAANGRRAIILKADMAEGCHPVAVFATAAEAANITLFRIKRPVRPR